jgi:hypothetical protein
MLLFAAQPMVILRTRFRGRRRPFCWRAKIETWHDMNKLSLPLVSVLPALVLWSPFTWRLVAMADRVTLHITF